MLSAFGHPNISQQHPTCRRKVAKRIRNTLRLTVLAYVSLACWDRLALARVARLVLFDISVRVYGLSFFVLSCARVWFVTCWCLISFYLRKRFCSILTLACGRPPYNLPIFSYLTWVGVIILFRFPYTLKALAAGRLFVYTPYPRAVFSLHFKAFNTVCRRKSICTQRFFPSKKMENKCWLCLNHAQSEPIRYWSTEK